MEGALGGTLWKEQQDTCYHSDKLTLLSQWVHSKVDGHLQIKGSLRDTDIIHQIISGAFTLISVQTISTKLIGVDQIKFVCKTKVVYRRYAKALSYFVQFSTMP